MKKINLLIAFIVMAMSFAWANPVDPTTAKTMAQQFWNLNCAQRGAADLRNVAPEAGFSQLYIFNNENGGGFVILSADNSAIPVLGYSDNSNLDINNMPSNMRNWLMGYERTISAMVEANVAPTQEVSQQWSNLEAGRQPVEQQRDAVSPLLSTTWNQDAPYNNLCPGGSATGCVATAMAQVMKYHAWPTTGTGSHSYACNYSQYGFEDYGTLSANFASTTYDWSNMLNNYPYSSSGTSTQRTAVATLMYHCGVAVEMMYSPNGSGAYTLEFYTGCPSAEYALKHYFNYKSTLDGKQKSSYTDTQWKNLLKTDLNASHPVIYAGNDENNEGGHCFVCDGYNSSDYFHFNWGWSGYGDGYFALTSLAPGGGGIGGGSYDFTYGQEAIFGIEPNGTGGGGGGGEQGSNYDIKMYADFTVSPNPLQQNQSASITATIANYGTEAFAGDIKLVLETANATEVQVIQQGTLNGSLASGTGANLSLSGTITASAGTYKLALYYKGSEETVWTYVGENNGHANPIDITVAGGSSTSTADLQMYSNFSINPSTLVKNQSASVSVDVANVGEGSFTGKLKLVLETSSAQQVQLIQQLNVTEELPYNYYNTYSFSGTITANAGTYKLALYYQPTGSSTWTYVGTSYNSSYANPKSVTVVSNTTGIADQEAENAQIYPNPATDFITLQNTETVDVVEIFNMMGAQVIRKTHVAAGEQINISQLTSGIYFLKQTTDGSTSTQKFIKR